MEIMTRVTAIRVSSDMYSCAKDISERHDVSMSTVLRAIIAKGLVEASEAGPELFTADQSVKHRRRSSPARRRGGMNGHASNSLV
jgi:predicted DNA-binding protein